MPGAPEPQVTLRPRSDVDNDFILDLTGRELAPILEEAWDFSWDAGHARKFLLDLLTKGETRIAELPEKEPVGFVWYLIFTLGRWPRRPVFWLNYLVVDRHHQGQGTGSAIMDLCEAEARRRGCRDLELWVQEINHGARRFYERRAFRPVTTVKNNLWMRKRL